MIHNTLVFLAIFGCVVFVEICVILAASYFGIIWIYWDHNNTGYVEWARTGIDKRKI